MKTNFDVWRDQLTPEKAWGVIRLCSYCPALSVCEKMEDNEDWTCGRAFGAWANAPAKEED